MRKKFSGATIVESVLIVTLIIALAICGLGSLGQAIQEKLGLIFSEKQLVDPTRQLREQIYQATLNALSENSDAEMIATAAADAAVAEYNDALGAGYD